MPYPQISEYVEAIKSAEDNFKDLSYLRPVLGDDGNPIMTSGNFAVVFKMKDIKSGKFYALKCFIKEEENREEAYHQITEELKDVDSPYLTSVRYMDKELFVDTDQTDETEFPILLMDWVEGMTLDKYIQEYVYRYQRAENLNETTESQEKAAELSANGYELENIAYQFSSLAVWLLQQPFAHGDLKPDNILVREDGTLVLVDYDGMYVPAMKGKRARELGSPDFRHPLRNENDFDEHIDDFPLSSILLSLLAIANEPFLLEKYGGDGRLLLSEQDYRNIVGSEVLDALRPLMADRNLTTYLSLFYLCYAQKSLFKESYHLFTLPEPEKPTFMLEDENLSTEVTDEDLANAWTDEFGVIYSADKKRLLQFPDDIELNNYYIKRGTLVICDCAFCDRKNLEFVSIPNSVKEIGYSAFGGCEKLIINIPDKVRIIGERSFSGCCQLESVYIPRTVAKIGEAAFSYCKRLSSIVVDKDNEIYDSRNNCNAIIKKDKGILISGCYNTIIPDNISIIGNSAFCGCTSLLSISLPNSIVEIEDDAFSGCHGLMSIEIPNSVMVIGNFAFRDCSGITSIFVDKNNKIYDSRNNCNAIIESSSNSVITGCKNTIIPNDIEKLNDFAFSGCLGLKTMSIPQGVLEIGDGAFDDCVNLESIDIPKDVKRIGKWAFRGCKKLTNFNLPISLKEIGEFAFYKCEKIQSVIIPSGIAKIANWLFDGCSCLRSIVLPITIKEIGFSAFRGCASLTSIDIPDSVSIISSHAFEGCCSLSSFFIPKSVTKIGDNAFSGCSLIESIIIPDSVLHIGSGAFRDCTSLSSVLLPNNITRIEYQLFYNCKQLNSICIPPKVTDICMYAFSFCAITSIFIPKSVSSIHKRAFIGCYKLESIIVEEGNLHYDSRNNCNAIIETNNNKLIRGCSNTTIPDTVITIGESAFNDCLRLKSITIPKRIIKIEDYSFSYFLRTLIIDNHEIEINKNALIRCKNLATIYIPSGTRRRFEEMLPDYKEKLVERTAQST